MRRIHKTVISWRIYISIHAPRVRCDISSRFLKHWLLYFNPRTSCEVRRYIDMDDTRDKIFQSTHLVWGATISAFLSGIVIYISIHAPRVRCDDLSPFLLQYFFEFQSTHLVWGATFLSRIYNFRCFYFNPRTSCEVRPRFSRFFIAASSFQSTHLVWGATWILKSGGKRKWHFNPRTSCEVRQAVILMVLMYLSFQSTHLVWGATMNMPYSTINCYISIHAPRVRCDRP